MYQTGLKQQSAEIVFSGELTIQRASALKDALLAAIAGTETLFIRLEQPLRFDLSFLQILCSLHRTVTPLGKTAFLLGDVPDELAALLRQAGFRDEEVCAVESEKSSLWQFAA